MSEANRDKTMPPHGDSKVFPDFIVAPPGRDAAVDMPSLRPVPGGPFGGTPGPVAAAPARPPRARGLGFASFCAFVALAGALGTIAAPTLRPMLADALRKQFGEQSWIPVVTGTGETRPAYLVELDLQRFDQRISALSTALAAAPAGTAIDDQTLARFIEASGEAERIAGLAASVQKLDDQVLQLTKTLGALETRFAKLDARADGFEAADRALSGRLDAAEGAARETAPKLSALESGATQTGVRIDALTGTVTGLAARAEEMDRRLTETADTAKAATAEVAVRTEALAGTVTELSGRAEALGTDTSQLGERLTATDAEVDAVGDRVAAAETALEEARKTTVDGVAALNARVDAVDAKIPTVSPTAGPVLLALATRIRTALDEGEPFAPELAALRPFAERDPAIAGAVDRLAPLSTRGGPSLSLLKRDFNTAAKRVMDAEEAAGPYWYERQVATMQGWFGWATPVSLQQPQAADLARATLGRAAASLTAGNLAEAAVEMRALNGPGANQAEPWLRVAAVRLEADKALRALNEGALARLAASRE